MRTLWGGLWVVRRGEKYIYTQPPTLKKLQKIQHSKHTPLSLWAGPPPHTYLIDTQPYPLFSSYPHLFTLTINTTLFDCYSLFFDIYLVV
nr:MAG TPA: hypothetical protein [Caudoviricetes sp.]